MRWLFSSDDYWLISTDEKWLRSPDANKDWILTLKEVVSSLYLFWMKIKHTGIGKNEGKQCE